MKSFNEIRVCLKIQVKIIIIENFQTIFIFVAYYNISVCLLFIYIYIYDSSKVRFNNKSEILKTQGLHTSITRYIFSITHFVWVSNLKFCHWLITLNARLVLVPLNWNDYLLIVSDWEQNNFTISLLE